MEITIKDLENDLKSLPTELLQQVSDYVAFLKMKYTGQVNEDWADYLSESQKESISKGLEDIDNGKVYSHEEAKERIRNYLSEKSK
ncbi:hypothetical protein [Epilithonimonas arachidiradicis]|uniref:DUF2281 domain-containing protein n=1 Tax=Epilithonimonas arachidiradicis TaxID=1617282 RepID=A0A420D882_9FLAO|nr:hypothetical protein [Epilithonimonas arachidiradicis]RKE86880.1 hypothetical protein BXY58_2294 [Epilithonimonas arachidiradicis]GGG61364.1 hypothetical protein GCM10007332_24050 [Epilithonimonas arachidiradicis]